MQKSTVRQQRIWYFEIYCSGKQMQLHLMLEETGLLFSFFDFCENLSTEQMFSSSEEIESFLKDLFTK